MLDIWAIEIGLLPKKFARFGYFRRDGQIVLPERDEPGFLELQQWRRGSLRKMINAAAKSRCMFHYGLTPYRCEVDRDGYFCLCPVETIVDRNPLEDLERTAVRVKKSHRALVISIDLSQKHRDWQDGEATMLILMEVLVEDVRSRVATFEKLRRYKAGEEKFDLAKIVGRRGDLDLARLVRGPAARGKD